MPMEESFLLGRACGRWVPQWGSQARFWCPGQERAGRLRRRRGHSGAGQGQRFPWGRNGGQDGRPLDALDQTPCPRTGDAVRGVAASWLAVDLAARVLAVQVRVLGRFSAALDRHRYVGFGGDSRRNRWRILLTDGRTRGDWKTQDDGLSEHPHNPSTKSLHTSFPSSPCLRATKEMRQRQAFTYWNLDSIPLMPDCVRNVSPTKHGLKHADETLGLVRRVMKAMITLGGVLLACWTV